MHICKAFTCERVYIIEGPEVGPKWEGKVLIIVKMLYVIKASDVIWYLKLADNLKNILFRPFQAGLICGCALGWITMNILL